MLYWWLAAGGEETASDGSGRRVDQSEVDRGTLHFSLKHDTEASALVVTVVKATGLMPGSGGGGGDTEISPYVKVRLDKHQQTIVEDRVDCAHHDLGLGLLMLAGGSEGLQADTANAWRTAKTTPAAPHSPRQASEGQDQGRETQRQPGL